ncbi:MAG: hypothetical protein IJ365_02235 [Clostridia bacterium]|nr:hypothetical protein [Clostridia bacterium]
MNISFIGGGDRVEACYKLFEGKSGFTPIGFFCNPISGCSKIADKYKCAIFLDIDSLCSKSEVIVIATEDAMLPAVVQTLTRLHIHDKIIISIADGISAHELDTGYDNTYVVLSAPVPFEQMNDKELAEASVVCEGYGGKYDLLCTFFNLGGFSCSRLTPAQMRLYRANMHLLHYGILSLIITANKLCKITTDDKHHNIAPAVRNAIKSASYGTSAISEPYKTGKPQQIKELINTFENNGIDSIAQLYGAVAKVITENSRMENDVADDIFRMLRQINH